MKNTVITVLLCIDELNSTSDSESLYVIYASQLKNDHLFYVDAAVAEVKDDRFVLTEYLLQNQFIVPIRYDLSGLNNLLNVALPNKYFTNICIL